MSAIDNLGITPIASSQAQKEVTANEAFERLAGALAENLALAMADADATLTGAQRVARTVRVFLSNLGDRPRRLTVVERVPVSEIDDVQVKVTEPGGAAIDARDGFARFSVEVPAGGTHELELGYRIEAAARVHLDL